MAIGEPLQIYNTTTTKHRVAISQFCLFLFLDLFLSKSQSYKSSVQCPKICSAHNVKLNAVCENTGNANAMNLPRCAPHSTRMMFLGQSFAHLEQTLNMHKTTSVQFWCSSFAVKAVTTGSNNSSVGYQLVGKTSSQQLVVSIW